MTRFAKKASRPLATDEEVADAVARAEELVDYFRHGVRRDDPSLLLYEWDARSDFDPPFERLNELVERVPVGSEQSHQLWEAMNDLHDAFFSLEREP